MDGKFSVELGYKGTQETIKVGTREVCWQAIKQAKSDGRHGAITVFKWGYKTYGGLQMMTGVKVYTSDI